MKSIYPAKLNSGDTLRVIAPASSVATFKPRNLAKIAKTRLSGLGLKVKFSKNAYQKDIFGSSSIQSRINDLHQAFKDTRVKAIICACGGYNANTLLPYIDWGLIKKNPKALMGYSDITILCNAIYAKTGLITYLGPTLSTMGMKEEKGIVSYMLDSIKHSLMDTKTYSISTSKYFNERTVKTKRNSGPKILQKGKAIGTAIGGNLCSLNLLQGTPYMPSLKNAILFIEDDDFGGSQSLFEFERNLESLLQIKDAKHIKAIIIGRFQKGFVMTDQKLDHILKNKAISKNIPIISNVDFGHTTPMAVIPIGGRIKIDTNSKEKILVLRH